MSSSSWACALRFDCVVAAARLHRRPARAAARIWRTHRASPRLTARDRRGGRARDPAGGRASGCVGGSRGSRAPSRSRSLRSLRSARPSLTSAPARHPSRPRFSPKGPGYHSGRSPRVFPPSPSPGHLCGLSCLFMPSPRVPWAVPSEGSSPDSTPVAPRRQRERCRAAPEPFPRGTEGTPSGTAGALQPACRTAMTGFRALGWADLARSADRPWRPPQPHDLAHPAPRLRGSSASSPAHAPRPAARRTTSHPGRASVPV